MPSSRNTKNRSAKFNSERNARAVAREKLGKDPVEVEPNKLRSQDGKWQYRYKDEAVKYAFDDSNERLEQFYVEKSHKFRKFIKLCCEDIIKNIHECEPELMKELYKEMDLILLNGC